MVFYSHVNEDNSAENSVMQALPISDLYVIAGSGERVISLLNHPDLKKVFILDNNQEALYLTELKITALKYLPTHDYLHFVGFHRVCDHRWIWFQQFKNLLTEPCRAFWIDNRKYIESGVCNCGHFEQFLRKARPFFKYFLGTNFYKCFTQDPQSIRCFPHLRWLIVKFFFSFKLTYLLFGMKDEAFVSNESTLSIIPRALQKSIDDNKVAQSCLFHLVFNGHLEQMPELELPVSFQKNTLNRIREALHKQQFEVSFQLGDVLDLINKIDKKTLSNRFFSLSDILSFAGVNYLKKLLSSIERLQFGMNIAIFRTFVRNRIDRKQITGLSSSFDTISDISGLEKTNFYQVFKIQLH